jgi:hypothetical protein
MVPHSAVRLGLFRFEQGIAGVQEDPSVLKLQALEQWYSVFFYPFVHHHHDIEEQDFFPFLDAQMPAGVTLRPDHKHEHVDLMKAMDDFKKELANLVRLCKKDPTSDDLSSELRNLASRVRSFNDNMRGHLDGEERHICPLMTQYMTEKQISDKEQEIVQGVGLGAAKLMLPWILESMYAFDESADKKNYQMFLNNIPPPLRLFLWASWQGFYDKNNKGVIEALARGAVPADKACGACVLQ